MPLKCAWSKSVRRGLCRGELKCEYALPRGGTNRAKALAFLQSVLRGNAEPTWADATGVERA